jgi:hypothetical protein
LAAETGLEQNGESSSMKALFCGPNHLELTLKSVLIKRQVQRKNIHARLAEKSEIPAARGSGDQFIYGRR